MEKSTEKRKKFTIPTYCFFIIATFIVIIFLPQESKKKYSYSENKPWQYDLLTAPFNFYIQKSNVKINAEKDSIMKLYQPYYVVDTVAGKKYIPLFEGDAKAQSIPQPYIDYIGRKLEEIYKAGVISIDDYQKVEILARKKLLISNENNVFAPRHISSLYTPKSAYDKILEDVPPQLKAEKIRDINLNNYLGVNILFDDATSNKAIDEMLKQVALYSGEIQQGEKIINRGEIVTTHTKDILDSYTEISESKNDIETTWIWGVVGEVILVSSMMLYLFLYLQYYQPDAYNRRKSVLFILTLVIVFPIILGVMINNKLSGFVYIIPFAISTILIRTLIDSRMAITSHMISVLICSLMLPPGISTQFIIIQVLVGYTCIFSLHRLSERSQLVFCSLFIFITYTLCYTGWLLVNGGGLEAIQENKWVYLQFGVNCIFVSFAYLLIYISERLFGFMSEVSMIELSNTNRPLLQMLSESAPGTFQHSMQVSNLVVAAAQRIGANPALVRVGALYHDIGKIANPIYFTENQMHGIDPHARLTEKESAKIIIGHIEEGVKLAKKYKLPPQIIDFILTHHGRSKAKYFYNSYVNKHPDEIVNIEDFTYTMGRNPFSKETALLMMGDTIEAASRSLSEYNRQTISELVNKLIDSQVNEGMFKYAPITFKDIDDAKEEFIDKLVTIYHTRISYPELKMASEDK